MTNAGEDNMHHHHHHHHRHAPPPPHVIFKPPPPPLEDEDDKEPVKPPNMSTCTHCGLPLRSSTGKLCSTAGKCPACGTAQCFLTIGEGPNARLFKFRFMYDEPSIAIEFPCRDCGKGLKSNSNATGKARKCPSCGMRQTFLILHGSSGMRVHAFRFVTYHEDENSAPLPAIEDDDHDFVRCYFCVKRIRSEDVSRVQYHIGNGYSKLVSACPDCFRVRQESIASILRVPPSVFWLSLLFPPLFFLFVFLEIGGFIRIE
jgi:hypothetical protein